MTFTQRILVSMAAGVAVGVILNAFGGTFQAGSEILVDGVFYVLGAIFLALLRLMVVPLVLVSLVCGVTALGDFRALGRVGAKTLGLYLVTTAIAITIALSIASLIDPGQGFQLQGEEFNYEATEPPPLADVIINMFPQNPIRAMADDQMLQIILFALLLGFAIAASGERGKRIASLFEDLNEVILNMVLIIIKVAPVGVFALIARTFATQGLDIFRPLLGYCFVVIAGLLLQLVLTYGGLLRLAGLSPLRFLSQVRAPMSFAFSTSSSGATIPVTLNTVETRLGVKNSVASFTVPLGATINMDGTAIMQGAATVFIANVYGIDLGIGDFIAVILTATLASIGTAAVPSAGLIMLAMVLTQVGLPVEGIALIIGVDRLLDMLRTAVNVAGDAAVTCFVASTEDALDRAVFDDPKGVLDPDVRRGSLAGS
ncbi:MAG TPA: dicarboxylate/amino acid:cation symporter [Gammaproteobacteria bacterium]